MATLISRIKANARGELKSGATKLALIEESIGAMDSNGDWTNLAWIVSLASATDKSRVKAIIEAACGVTFKSDPKQPTGLRAVLPDAELAVSDGANDWTGRAKLGAYVRLETSFRSKLLTTGNDDIPALLVAKETVIDADAKMKAAAIACLETGMTIEEAVAMLKYHMEEQRENHAA